MRGGVDRSRRPAGSCARSFGLRRRPGTDAGTARRPPRSGGSREVGSRVSDVICRFANDKEADLVVMGAYGHSRFREAILGGGTRRMLQQAEIPVLMAH